MAVFVLLIEEFIGKGSLGLLYLTIGNAAWGFLVNKIFPWPALQGRHLLFQFGLGMAVVSASLLLHVFR